MTQYVYLNDTVEFECATKPTDFILFVTFKGSIGCLKTRYQTLPNGGMMVSCNVTANSEANGTHVTCHTTNGNNTEPAYVYVQG